MNLASLLNKLSAEAWPLEEIGKLAITNPDGSKVIVRQLQARLAEFPKDRLTPARAKQKGVIRRNCEYLEHMAEYKLLIDNRRPTDRINQEARKVIDKLLKPQREAEARNMGINSLETEIKELEDKKVQKVDKIVRLEEEIKSIDKKLEEGRLKRSQLLKD